MCTSMAAHMRVSAAPQRILGAKACEQIWPCFGVLAGCDWKKHAENCFLSPGREFHRMLFFSFCRGLHLLHCQITCTNDQKYFPEISIFYNIACESAWVSRKPPKGLTFRWAQVGARRKVGQRCRVLGRWSQAHRSVLSRLSTYFELCFFASIS